LNLITRGFFGFTYFVHRHYTLKPYANDVTNINGAAVTRYVTHNDWKPCHRRRNNIYFQRAHRFFKIFLHNTLDVCVYRNGVGVLDDRLCAMSRVHNIRSRRRRRRYPDRKKTSKESAASDRTRNAGGGCVQESRGKYVISVQQQCHRSSRDVINKTPCTDNLLYTYIEVRVRHIIGGVAEDLKATHAGAQKNRKYKTLTELYLPPNTHTLTVIQCYHRQTTPPFPSHTPTSTAHFYGKYSFLHQFARPLTRACVCVLCI